jgi:hypothetical protein
MRRFLAAVAALSAALAMSAPSVAVAAPERTGCTAAISDFQESCFFPAPADWVRAVSSFRSCSNCRKYGQQGVAQGRWSDFHCAGRPQGLDYYYDLYIPPTG